MVAERMPESLVLLRRLLCADLEDVIFLDIDLEEVGNDVCSNPIRTISIPEVN